MIDDYARLEAMLLTLPQAFKYERKQRKMSMEKVAQQTGCGLMTLWRIENSGSMMRSSIDTALKILRWIEKR